MLVMIWAQARGRAIGKDGALPWHVPEDMALFKRLTLGHPVIMGRKTWDSLDPRWKPLPGRKNFVVSKTMSSPVNQAANMMPATSSTLAKDTDTHEPHDAHPYFCTSLEAAYESAHAADPDALVWLIGGGQLFTYALDHHLAEGAVITDLDLHIPDADAFAPALPDDWNTQGSLPAAGWLHSAKADVNYRFTAFAAPGVLSPHALQHLLEMQ
ncbi:MAG: dihydrofolate reductase [Actinomycetaceae bacterium]|nr:dihydrofolate reductase [Arcanobacterium sp.]MDD7687721.1 dihydrofolate reductase [Actinomycetaceae bacterium]MDY5274244.1 dihydrofolate reductase [Arcanobacterium sp.]